MVPELAGFLNPPSKPGQGKRQRQPDYSYKQENLQQAIDDVHRIRQIWARPAPYGYGRWKRSYDDDVSAEAIAAARHGLSVEAVREAMRRGVPGLRYFAKNTTRTSTK
jgi:hypothetical protein